MAPTPGPARRYGLHRPRGTVPGSGTRSATRSDEGHIRVILRRSGEFTFGAELSFGAAVETARGNSLLLPTPSWDIPRLTESDRGLKRIVGSALSVIRTAHIRARHL